MTSKRERESCFRQTALSAFLSVDSHTQLRLDTLAYVRNTETLLRVSSWPSFLLLLSLPLALPSLENRTQPRLFGNIKTVRELRCRNLGASLMPQPSRINAVVVYPPFPISRHTIIHDIVSFLCPSSVSPLRFLVCCLSNSLLCTAIEKYFWWITWTFPSRKFRQPTSLCSSEKASCFVKKTEENAPINVCTCFSLTCRFRHFLILLLKQVCSSKSSQLSYFHAVHAQPLKTELLAWASKVVFISLYGAIATVKRNIMIPLSQFHAPSL